MCWSRGAVVVHPRVAGLRAMSPFVTAGFSAVRSVARVSATLRGESVSSVRDRPGFAGFAAPARRSTC